MPLFIAVQSDKPIPVGASQDEMKVLKGAQDWANYSRKDVNVLKVEGPFVDLHFIVLPDKRG